jgi:hypothetical protein
LSPDNRMLMMMISSPATQNCGDANSTRLPFLWRRQRKA